MKKVGFILKGQTFLRSMGTLIHFAEKCGIEPWVFYYEKRSGKPYDNIDPTIVIDKMGCKHCIPVKNDHDLVKLLDQHKCDAVVGQDIQWHFPFIVGTRPTFSVSMFFDTLHYAATRKGQKHSVPTKTYFASEWFRDKFYEMMGHPSPNAWWPAASLGSPTFDHALFADVSAYTPGSVLFLTPPQASLNKHMIQQVNELIDYCKKWNRPFILKDRPKTPWNASDLSKVVYINHESGFPYASLTLLLNTQVHITAYGTSALESNYFGRAAVNLPAGSGGGGRNHAIQGYGTDHIYNNGLCVPTTGNLVDDYESALKRNTPPVRNLTADDNNSIDILRDIINTLENSE